MSFSRLKVVIAVLVALLAISSSIALAYGDDNASTDSNVTDLAAPPSQPRGPELENKRTATSETFLLPDGSRETRIYETPIHYRDADGDWKPIDESLEPVGGTALTNGANSFDLTLPTRMGSGPVRLSDDGHWVAVEMLGTPTEAAELDADRQVASYDAANGTRFELTGLTNGVKEEIELPDLSAPSTFHFELTASDGIVPREAPDGSIKFRDADDELVATLPAPTIADSSGIPAPSDAVRYILEPQGNGWQVAVEADRDWLSEPNRQWPVRIDPTIMVPSPTRDCSIFNGPYNEYNLCSYTGMPSNGIKALYKSSGEDEYARLLLQFDLSSIPSTASISSATLGVYSPSEARNTAGVELSSVTHSWATSVNWTHYESPGSGLWKTPGGDYGLPGNHNISIYTASRGSESGWWNFTSQSVAWLVQNWISGTLPNYGVLLKLMDERWHECSPSCTERLVEFTANGAPNTPYLSVNYYPPAPPDSKVTSPTDGTRSAKRFKLQAAWTHEGVTGVTFQYQAPEGWENVPAAKVTNEKGEAIEWPLPVKATDRSTEPLYWNAPEGVPYQVPVIKGHIRALLSGSPGAGGYTQPVEAQLDRDLGGPKDALTQIGPGTVDLLTGNFTVSQTDVGIPLFNSSLEFSRSFNSRAAKAEEKGVLGPGWVPGSSVEEAGGSAWKSIREEEVTETYFEYLEFENEAGEIEVEESPETITYKYALLTTPEGEEIAFEKQGASYVVPPEMAGWSLSKDPSGRLVLSEPEGIRTIFENKEGGKEYVPVLVSQPGGEGNKSQMLYEFPAPGKKRLSMIIAPSPPGSAECTASNATTLAGCHAVAFNYVTAAYGDRLSSITYYAPGNGGSSEVAHYVYNSEGRLIEEYDPRISPKLAETYTYQTGGQLKTITPPGQEPWTMEYGTTKEDELNDGRLIAVKRPSLLSSPATAQTTIAYEVPLSGSGAPYGMGLTAVAEWGQTDVPLDATAVFPPSEVPSSPPSSYGQPTVYYMNAEGRLTNTATPSGAGTSAPSITTAETDQFGNVVRELTPQNRLRALAAGAGSVAKSHELETMRVYSADGTELLEETGPKHQIRLASGSSVEGRAHQVLVYDEEMPSGLTPDPHLLTTGTSGALVGSEFLEQRVTKSKYNWNLRKPTESIVDPNGLNIRSVIQYDEATGLPVETRQPSNSAGGGPGTTKTIYYSAERNHGQAYPECFEVAIYAGLPCLVLPAEQVSGTGRPQLLVRRYNSFNAFGQPTEVTESAGGGSENVRNTTITYDAAGRPLTRKVEGGGTAVPQTKTIYDPTTGTPNRQEFACEAECGVQPPQFSASFGSSGSGSGQLNGPRGITSDRKGHVWVVDRANNRVEEFNEKGEFLGQFGSSGSNNGQFKEPSGIAVTAAGNLWVVDSGNYRVEEFNEKGEFLQKFGSKATSSKGTKFVKPDGIAIAPGGKLWISDNSGSRIAEFRESVASESERFIRDVATTGSGNPGLINPLGLAVDSLGNLWAADETGNRVLEYTAEGAFIQKFGSSGSGNGQFNGPKGVAVVPSGNIVVVDRGNNRVQEFQPNGTYLYKFGTSGSGGENFKEPHGIAVGAGNAVFVTDTGNNHVNKWSIDSTFDSQATTMTYDDLGRPTAYEDADGSETTMTYDVNGRPVATTDSKGAQTITYDPTSGLPTKLEDSAAGTFTAAYNSDGNLVERGLPNGLVAKTTYDEAGVAVHLSYNKATTWLDFGAERSIYGRVLAQTSTLSSQQYSYDKAGRLTQVKDTQGGSCTTRTYSYDLDSNRENLVTRAPGIGGACDTTSTGVTQTYTYDKADRLLGTGLTYDDFGRITSLPGSYAGESKALTTGYFSNDMVASQSQGGITNTFQLDGALRQRQRIQGGGLEGTEIFHYAGASDSPAWTERAGTWTRNIIGINGELAAIQDSVSGVALQLTNLHGDVIATASLSQSAAGPTATFESDEFGNPKGAGPGRFGWLGGKQRRTELPSGVIQMGVRSYIPTLGRFLTPDPIPGGSANAYDYANQDPVNNLDLTGEKFCSQVHGAWACGRNAREYKSERRRLKRQYNRETRTARGVSGTMKTIVLISKGGASASSILSDLEKAANAVIKKVGNGAKKVFSGENVISISLTGPAYTAAQDAFKMAGKWGPDRMIQAWECGWQASVDQCDPLELLYGPPETAR